MHFGQLTTKVCPDLAQFPSFLVSEENLLSHHCSVVQLSTSQNGFIRLFDNMAFVRVHISFVLPLSILCLLRLVSSKIKQIKSVLSAVA